MGVHMKFSSCIAFAMMMMMMMMMTSVQSTRMPFRGCKGQAMYRVIFRNFISNGRFKNIPARGLVFSPLSVITHSNRASFLTSRGYASDEVSEIAKTGNNIAFLASAKRMRNESRLVKSVASSDGPIVPKSYISLRVRVDCTRPFVTALSMVAPSPDWIVQINNVNLYNRRRRKFVYRIAGNLQAYDAGVDSGSNFTDPADPSLDIPTKPQLNIAPLSEDPTDPFMGRIIGRYIIQRFD